MKKLKNKFKEKLLRMVLSVIAIISVLSFVSALGSFAAEIDSKPDAGTDSNEYVNVTVIDEKESDSQCNEKQYQNDSTKRLLSRLSKNKRYNKNRYDANNNSNNNDVKF